MKRSLEMVMSHDREPLTPMGTQSQDTVLVEAAARAKKAEEQTAQGAAGIAERWAKPDAETRRELGDLRKVAVDMAAAYVDKQPIAALLIAGAAGALLAGLVTLASRGD